VPTVRVPSPLLRLTGGASTVAVEAGDVRGVLRELDARYPGVADRLLDGDGELHRFVHVFVRDEDVRSQRGLDTPVGDGDSVAIVPAVAGGA
jgi:sulfur-carrier protein